jgi:hypothetical protein
MKPSEKSAAHFFSDLQAIAAIVSVWRSMS